MKACSGGDGKFSREKPRAAYMRRHASSVLAFPKEEMPRSGDPGLGFTLFQAPAARGALQAQQGGVVPVGRLWGVSRRGRIGCCADYMCRYGGRRRGQSARGEACTKETIAIARGACLYRNRLRSRLPIYG